MSALSHEPLRVSSDPPEQSIAIVLHFADSEACEPPERVMAASDAVKGSDEDMRLPPDAVKLRYDAGEVVIVTSRSLKRRASTENTRRSPSISALMYDCMLRCVRTTAVPAGTSSLRLSFMPSAISMPFTSVGISKSHSTISPSGVR